MSHASETKQKDRLANAKAQARAFLHEIVLVIRDMKDAEAAGDSGERERKEDEARAMVLSVEIRDGWKCVGGDGEASEYRLLLSTGGPACCIMGDLNAYSEVATASIYVQDWFLPWTAITDASEDEREALLHFARIFYFGE